MWSYLRSNPAPAATGARSLHISEKPPLAERDRLPAGDDEMVEHPDVDQSQRFLQPLRDQFIRRTRLGNPRRVCLS